MAAPLRASWSLLGAASHSLTQSLAESLRARPAVSFAFRLPASLSTIAVASAIPLRLPSLLEELWDSVLRAVPKKKTSHRKKRQRFLVGKALQNVTALNKCPGCGATKRAHLLCPWCVREIQDMWKGKEPQAETKAETKEGS